jgi:diguanylate cyclase (GGDEF)-like protein
MATLTDYLLELTDHRDREPLHLTFAKALIDLTSVQRVVMAWVVVRGEEKRWLDVVTLDARGGGKVADPARADFLRLPLLGDNPDRAKALSEGLEIEVAWAGADGPRIYHRPLLAEVLDAEQGVLEIHTPNVLNEEERDVIARLHGVYRNMHALLAWSDHDALTGLLNRKALADTFYGAVLEELSGQPQALHEVAGDERRRRVMPNYWLADIAVDEFHWLDDRLGHRRMETVTQLVARIMNSTFRTYDKLFRLEGDRFAALFHCPEEALALGVLERLRANIERFTFPAVGNRVTVSIGLARVQADDAPEQALARAEAAVDAAQALGCNRVCSSNGRSGALAAA